MLRIITSLLVAISFLVPIKSQKEQFALTDTAFASAVVASCAPLVTADSAPSVKKSTFKTQKEKHKKKKSAHHHSKHKPKVSHHHIHVSAPHPIPQKISTSHGPLHLTSPPFC
jgi:ABC-type nickel/cobalt efflux system permease component RcnA